MYVRGSVTASVNISFPCHLNYGSHVIYQIDHRFHKIIHCENQWRVYRSYILEIYEAAILSAIPKEYFFVLTALRYIFTLCSSRKYPYPHGGHFCLRPPTPPEISVIIQLCWVPFGKNVCVKNVVALKCSM